MYRRVVILLILAGVALLAGSSPATNDADPNQVAERVKAHINELMNETCKSVLLKRHADAVYQGHAEFLSGTRINLEVSLSDGAIEYRFLPQPESPRQAAERRLAELEATIAWQEAEITRLRGLCLQAGIDVDRATLQAAPARSEDANGIATESTWESPPTIYEDQQAIPEEPPRFTWRVYAEIGKGMSYAEVARILDDSGDLISGSYFDEAQNEVIVWTNPDDSHICVVFQDGRVLVKTQFGLPEDVSSPPR